MAACRPKSRRRRWAGVRDGDDAGAVARLKVRRRTGERVAQTGIGEAAGQALLGPVLAPGAVLTHWQHGPTMARRYDLPDRPMPGGMDAAFFLTRDRNVIPHEYPCRTAFAAAHRGRRPEVTGAFVP